MADGENGGGEAVDVVALQAANQQLSDEVASLTADKAHLQANVDDLTAAHGTVQDGLARANADLEAMTAERDALLAAKDAADTAATATPAAVDKLRKVGPVKDQPRAVDLLELIKDGGPVQLAFSDGKKEIGGLAPRDISGNAWAVGPVGLKLNVPSLIISTSEGGAVELAGYGLFIDGTLVAYAARMDVLRIHPGQKFDITSDVVFP